MCEQLRCRVVEAVKRATGLVKKEFPDLDVGERALTHRLAVFMEREQLFAGYHVDCEYNRDGYNPKRLLLDEYVEQNGEKRLVLPDVIVHKRRLATDNLLVLEVKPRGGIDEHDRKKLKAYSSQLKYRFAYFLSLGDAEVISHKTRKAVVCPNRTSKPVLTAQSPPSTRTPK